MDIDTLKKRLQEHFTDGLVTIVGSGLSVAEGIPGMGALATHLLSTLPARVTAPSQAQWKKIAALLASGNDLETALLTHQPDTHLESLIAEETATLICPAELAVFQEVLSGARILRISRLLPHMLKPASGIPIVTTNYDRLVELAAETVGLGVDSLFVGHRFGRFDPKESRYSLCRRVTEKKVSGVRKAYPEFADHVKILKPHGSLDWFQGEKGPISCASALSLHRLLITPGLNKYRGGYHPPFDAHREAANREIDRASRFLIVGYGFNDEHLQTHLKPRLESGTPALIVTHTLTDNARKLIPKCPGVLAISRKGGDAGALITTHKDERFIPGSELWDLGIFVEEILTP